jgi:hypothetical protein
VIVDTLDDPGCGRHTGVVDRVRMTPRTSSIVCLILESSRTVHYTSTVQPDWAEIKVCVPIEGDTRLGVIN